MRTKRVLLDYSNLKDDELTTLAGKVVDCLDGHPTFTALPVPLEELQAQVTDYTRRWQKATNGGSLLEISEKNDARDRLLQSFKEIAFYVNRTAAGSRSLLLSSGLLLEADPKPSQVPGKVTGTALADGRQQNQMNVLFNRMKSAVLYEYEIAEEVGPDNQPIWKYNFQTSSSRGNVFAPTVPDRVYYLRVRARNKKGIGDWSDTASLRAR